MGNCRGLRGLMKEAVTWIFLATDQYMLVCWPSIVPCRCDQYIMEHRASAACRCDEYMLEHWASATCRHEWPASASGRKGEKEQFATKQIVYDITKDARTWLYFGKIIDGATKDGHVWIFLRVSVSGWVISNNLGLFCATDELSPCRIGLLVPTDSFHLCPLVQQSQTKLPWSYHYWSSAPLSTFECAAVRSGALTIWLTMINLTFKGFFSECNSIKLLPPVVLPIWTGLKLAIASFAAG